MLHIGCHLSSSKGFLAMGRQAWKLGADTFQFFTRNPRGSKAKELDSADAAALMALLAERNFATLSGGEQQLVLIARALCQRSDILVMDEPTSSLDYGNQLRVLERVRQLARQGYTVLLSTHDPQHALRFSQKVLALSGGQVAADGCTADVLTPELIRRLYGVEAVVLDTPCGRVLLPGEEGGSCV